MQINLIFSETRSRSTADQASPRNIYLFGDLFKFAGPTGQTDEGIQVPMPVKPIDMFLLRRHYRSDNITRMSEIILLTDVLEIIQLVPKFGRKMVLTWDFNNSMTLANEFYLNNFANKNTFHAILSYQ